MVVITTAGRRTNIKTYFSRFQFQKRGTVHLHLLVWLHDIRQTQHHLIRAYLVHKLQTSNKPVHCLNLQHPESFYESNEGWYIHHLKHPSAEFALNLHTNAYIARVLPALKCSMDYQTTDGVGMLLR